MESMTPKERVLATFGRQPVDRLATCESYWPETSKRWREEGHIQEGESLDAHFDHDISGGGWPNYTADLDFREKVIEETDQTVLVLNGNGATLRHMKNRTQTPEHVDFKVKERAAWEELIRPHITVALDTRRLAVDDYARGKRDAEDAGRFFVWHGVGPFELMHPVCGHEYLLLGMAMDPDWIKDMVNCYVDLTISIQTEVFSRHGTPDGVWFYEDMGFKEHPFISPEMYRELLFPGHKRLFEFAHDQGCKVIVHSCGFVEPLVGGLVEAGMDCLQAMEVKAGMEMHKLADRFGDRIVFMGNLDARELISNDRARIDAEMDKKIPYMLENGYGYMLHTDHSVPSDVDYETMRYWFKKGRSYARLVSA